MEETRTVKEVQWREAIQTAAYFDLDKIPLGPSLPWFEQRKKIAQDYLRLPEFDENRNYLANQIVICNRNIAELLGLVF